jgi:hypothetical protein
MLRLVRVALKIVAFFLLLSVVIGIGSPDTGALEKVVMLGLGALIVWGVMLLGRLNPS